jgi:hypothetical protein
MADTIQIIPENGASTWRGAVARNYSAETKSGDMRPFHPVVRSHRPFDESDSMPATSSRSTERQVAPAQQPVTLTRLRNSTPLDPRRIQILRQWEGIVDGVRRGEFTANLNSLTNPRGSALTGEISFDEVSDADRALIEPGAVFYWVIGYDKSPGGQVTRVSEIRFRRSPEWTDRKLKKVQSEGEEWFRQVVSDESR